MKSYRKIIFACCWIALLFLIAGCAAPQRFWPQEDMIGSETAAPDSSQIVLIASRSSDFKKLLVAKLHEQLAAEGKTKADAMMANSCKYLFRSPV